MSKKNGDLEGVVGENNQLENGLPAESKVEKELQTAMDKMC